MFRSFEFCLPFIILILFLSLPAMTFGEELTVAVAANVQFAFDELSAVFQEDTGVFIKEVIGSSGKLTTQIENGAPFDIFLSADTAYPEALYKRALTHNPPQIYVYGTLVLWTLNDLDLSEGVQILNDPSIKKVAVAAPGIAPYGREAIKALQHYGIYDQIIKKLVYGESISQTNSFIVSQAADIGFTAKSVVLSPHIKDKGKWIEVEQGAYEPIAQAMVILKFAENGHLSSAQKFYDFLFSKEAQDIFLKYGYRLP